VELHDTPRFKTTTRKVIVLQRLTPQQRQELSADPPRILDPLTRKTYVLVSEDVYERIQDLLVPGRLTLAEQQAILREAGRRAGWDDPEMDVYDREEPTPGQ
jgi:hypothetical protein